MIEFTKAICRQPATTFASGLTSANLGALGQPDYERMLQQHQEYVALLRRLGLAVEVLESLPAFPDAHFVEDVAVITPEVAVITRPGAPERRDETAAIRDVLAQHRPLAAIEAPGTLDGGDVMQVDEQVFVGLSERTNSAGAEQLASILRDYGYKITAVPLGASLHLKSDVNYIGRDTLIMTAAWAGAGIFAPYKRIIVNDAEAYAANTLLINGALLSPAGFTDTHEKLRTAGFQVIPVCSDEARKMDGGLSCLSLRF
jgi:dimethylargininase